MRKVTWKWKNCKDNTSNDPFSRCKSLQQFGYRWNWRSQNTVWLQVHNWTTISRKKELYIWYCVCVVKRSDEPHDTNDNVTTETQSTFHTAHINFQHVNWCMRDPMCAKSSSQVLVVTICTPHRGSSLSCASLMSSMHAVSVTLRLWVLHSIQLPLLLILFQSPALPFALLPQLWRQ